MAESTGDYFISDAEDDGLDDDLLSAPVIVPIVGGKRPVQQPTAPASPSGPASPSAPPSHQPGALGAQPAPPVAPVQPAPAPVVPVAGPTQAPAPQAVGAAPSAAPAQPASAAAPVAQPVPEQPIAAQPVAAPAPPPTDAATREEQLAQRLDRLMAGSPDIQASALVSLDGFTMASALPEGMQEDRVGAMSAAILGLGERAAVELGRGKLSQVFIEGSDGYVLLMAAGGRAVLTVLAARDTKLGLVLYDMRAAAQDIGTILG